MAEFYLGYVVKPWNGEAQVEAYASLLQAQENSRIFLTAHRESLVFAKEMWEAEERPLSEGYEKILYDIQSCDSFLKAPVVGTWKVRNHALFVTDSYEKVLQNIDMFCGRPS